jgi:hypothetical protein
MKSFWSDKQRMAKTIAWYRANKAQADAKW